jgi:hypothetical protein
MASVDDVPIMKEEADILTVVRVTIKMIDAPGIERAGAPDYAVNLIILGEKQFCKIGSILAGNSCDQCFLHKVISSLQRSGYQAGSSLNLTALEVETRRSQYGKPTSLIMPAHRR